MIVEIYDHTIARTLQINSDNIAYIDYSFIGDVDNAKANIYFTSSVDKLCLLNQQAIELYRQMKKTSF